MNKRCKNQSLKQFILLIIVIFLCNLNVFAQEQSDSRDDLVAITETIWDDDDKLFAISDKKSVSIFNSETLEILDSFSYYNVLALSFLKEKEDNLLIMSVTDDKSLNIADVNKELGEEKTFEPLTIPFLEERNMELAVFSKDGNYSAVLYEDNSVNLYYRLRYTQQLINRKLDGHKKEIYDLTFSPDGKLLATVSADKKIKIWSTVKSSFEAEISFYAKNYAKMDFTLDSTNVICATGKNKVSIKDFSNNEISSFNTKGIVVDIFSRPENKVAILTANNNLEFYDLTTGEYLGMLQSCNSGQVTSVAFSNDSKFILLGYSDGSAYKINIQEKMILKDQEIPKVRIVEKNEIIIKGYLYQENFDTAHVVTTHEYKYSPTSGQASIDILAEKTQGLKISAGYSFLPHPYASGTRINLGYVNSDWIYPFYVGMDARFSFGFPKKDFPFSYTVNGKETLNPFLVSAGMIVPIGLKIAPFANDIELLTELSVGCMTHCLWNAQSSANSVMGKFYPAFVASIAVGAGYKGISLKLNGDYDTQVGFAFSVDLGFVINFSKSKTGGTK